MARPRRTIFSSIGRYAAAVVLVGAAVMLGSALERSVGLREPALVFLTAVLVAGVVGGLGPSIFASVLAVLAYNFFFTEPFYTLNVTHAEDLVSLTVFLAVAALTSHLVARVRADAVSARIREARTAALYALSRDAAAASSADDLLPVIARHAGEYFHAGAVVLLPRGAELMVCAAHPAGTELPSEERAAAKWAWAEGRTAGIAAESAAGGSGWLHASLSGRRGQVAVLSLRLPPGTQLAVEEQRLLDALAQQAAVALERCLMDAALAEKAQRAVPAGERSGILLGKALADLIEERGGRVAVEEQVDRTSFTFELPRH